MVQQRLHSHWLSIGRGAFDSGNAVVKIQKRHGKSAVRTLGDIWDDGGQVVLIGLGDSR